MSSLATPSHTATTTTPVITTPPAAAHDSSNSVPRAVALLRATEDTSRPSSGHGPYTGANSAGWNTVASSARTSYTRVDLAGIVDEMEPPSSPQPLPETQPVAQEEEQEEDRVLLCFLCVSGGRKTMSFGPETAVGRVKELLLNAWPEDWVEERPPGSAYLRILHQGKILQDDDTLLKLKFPLTRTSASSPTPAASPSATIVHLSIRPIAPKGDNGDDDTLKKRGMMSRLMSSNSRSSAVGVDEAGEHGNATSRPGCCGCVIS